MVEAEVLGIAGFAKVRRRCMEVDNGDRSDGV